MKRLELPRQVSTPLKVAFKSIFHHIPRYFSNISVCMSAPPPGTLD